MTTDIQLQTTTTDIQEDEMIAYHGKEETSLADTLTMDLIRNGTLLVYPDSGEVYSKRWREGNRPLGCFNQAGYKVCTLHHGKMRVQAKVHRIIWISVNGLIPQGFVIDHINRIKSDNRISNLRLADAKLNSNNRRSYAGVNNSSAKINPHIAKQIRDFPSSYSITARIFNVSKSLVAQIKRGELWA